MMILRRAAAWLALLLPAALLTGALGSQYIGGLVPCEMCLWQRWPHWAALPLAALGVAFVTRSFGRVCTLLAALAILISGLIGGFHAGVEYGWWEGLTACTTSMDPNASAEDVPWLYDWRIRQRLLYWYAQLKALETRIGPARQSGAIAEHRAEIERIEAAVSHIPVPLQYSDRLYELRGAIDLVRSRISPA